MKLSVSSVLLWGLFCCGAGADEPLFSGPQPGEKVAPLRVLQVSGPQMVEEVQLAEAAASGPTLLVFAHKITEPALGFMIELEWYASQQKELSGHFVLLTDDHAATEQQVRRWWERPFFAGSPLSISLDGLEGPGSYGLNRHVDMTVLVVNNHTVVATFPLLGPSTTDVPKILAELARLLGTPAPSIEKIRAELRVERQRRRAARLAQNPVFKLAPDPELGRLMLQMLYREGNTEEYIREAAEAIRAWAGDDEKKKAEVVSYCKAILVGGFEYSQAAAKAVKQLAAGENPRE